MRIDRARLVLEYDQVPKDRANLLELIQDAGYTSLKRKPLYKCSDQQLWMVATRLYQTAQQVVEERNQRRSQQRMSSCERDWHNRLYVMFNIPYHQRDEITPQELEDRLLD